MHNSQQPLKHRKTKVNQTSFKVTEPTELMPFLSQQLPDQGRNNIKSLLAHHQILVDDEMVSQYNHPLVIGQQVSVIWGKVRKENQPRGLEILFEDDYLIVVVKEAGLLSIATAKEREQTAYSILSDHVKKKDAKNRIFIVHRLDRDTSGIMLFAKSEKVKSCCKRAGRMPLKSGDISRLRKDPLRNPKRQSRLGLRRARRISCIQAQPRMGDKRRLPTTRF